MTNSSVWVLVLLPMAVFSQKDIIMLEGRVTSDDGDVAATHVLNITRSRATITDNHGFFAIRVGLNDTLVFSATQFKKKEVVVHKALLASGIIEVPMEAVLTELDEVVVTPYNLTGDITRDLKRISTGPVVTASTLGLPNAYVRKMDQSERLLNEATSGGGIVPLNPILNGISGRTKMLKARVARDKRYARTQRVRNFYPDSLYSRELKLSVDRLDDFFYFCEVDQHFQSQVDIGDRIRLLEFLKRKSAIYRKNNNLIKEE